METTNEDLLELLTDLRALKNTGELDDDESLTNQYYCWRNRLDYTELAACINNDEQIRLAALALLVESKKSTMYFDKIELNFIEDFLIHNRWERLEFLPLIKKALKRMKESLAVLKRHVAKREKIVENQNKATVDSDLWETFRSEGYEIDKSQDRIEAYRIFYRNLRGMCIIGIGPGSTHGHKRLCLQILRLVQELLDKEFDDSPWTEEQGEKLFECLLLDTYETNKEIIYNIAKDIEPRLLRLDDPSRVKEIIDVALDLGNSIRPIDGITASYMLKISLLSPVIDHVLAIYDNIRCSDEDTAERATQRLIAIIIERLKDPLELAEKNIVAAAGKHSLFGHLLCIAKLIETCDLGKITKRNHDSWKKSIAEIIDISFRLNHAVSQVVNNSSPEGHFPMDMESSLLRSVSSDADASTVTPQMVLLCSWRTVKEVSLLFGYLSSKCPVTGETTNPGLIDETQLIKIGEHLVTLLFETKHRGAFEQAHVGFGQLCSRLWRLNQDSLKKLPKVWLHHLLLAISGLSPGNAKLCATRRSAGVPFMVQALVSSDPFVKSNPGSAIFHSVMKILLGFIELDETHEITSKTKSLMYDDTIFTDFQDLENTKNGDNSNERTNNETLTEIKTHSLNILRALFKHAQLGDLSKSYAADGLIAAIKSYDGKTWAERNAATLLFGSLITRIFGVQRTKDHVNLTLHNKMTGRIFFERHRDLLSFMLGELRTFVDARDTPIKPSVQSILLLLSRLYPSVNSDDGDSKWKIDEFIELVSACAKSKVYKTRELAARALVPLLTEKTVHTFIVKLFGNIASWRSRDVSLNALHGYMLQIVEITKSSRFKIDELRNADLDDFINGSRWIIDNLESNNSSPACFPLATAYVIALREFIKAGSTNKSLEILFKRILPHLNDSELLKNRPGRDIYELEFAKFFVTMMERQAFEVKWFCASSESFVTTWNSVFTHRNVQVQIIGWSNVGSVVEIISDEQLIKSAICIAINAMRKNLHPDLRNSLYNFVSEIFGDRCEITSYPGDWNLKRFATYALAILVDQMQTSCFQESPSFLRLLGTAYGQVDFSREPKLTSDQQRSIFKTILDNTWMGSADVECRIAISKVLPQVVKRSTFGDHDHWTELTLWTSVINLLVDDNAEVRSNMSRIFVDSRTRVPHQCHYDVMASFFDEFMNATIDRPSVTFAGLFAWTFTLSGDADYEMDESDVFNKCYNYEVFEPLRISKTCGVKLIALVQYFSPREPLPQSVKDWLAERLKTVESWEFSSALDLITLYGKTVPVIDKDLRAIMDPTHNDKLLQATAYEWIHAAMTNQTGPHLYRREIELEGFTI